MPFERIDEMSDWEIRETYYEIIHMPEEQRPNISEGDMKKILNAIERLEKKSRKFDKKVAGVMLMTDMEAAKAKGRREATKVFLRYITAKSDKSAFATMKSEFKDFFEGEQAGIPGKVLTAIVGVPLNMLLCAGITAAATGIRTIDFLYRMKQAPEFRKQLEEVGKAEALADEIEKYRAGQSLYDPYSDNKGSDLSYMLNDLSTNAALERAEANQTKR